MRKSNYYQQVELLLTVLPEVAKEECFALHGGTAINLFVRDMPRLSVDIDLTYLPLEERITFMKNNGLALSRIKEKIYALNMNLRVDNLQNFKLLVTRNNVSVKIEVNPIKRGCYSDPQKMFLSENTQNRFDAFCVAPVVSIGHLFGGKICAALDRQHPRDLFDIKYMLDIEGFSKDIKKGFIFYIISGDRPIHELLSPNLRDQRQVFDNQFTGMTNDTFSYIDFERTREKLITIINRGLSQDDKAFLLSIVGIKPKWEIYNFRRFPAVQWKLNNLKILKDTKPEKHRKYYNELMKLFS